MEQAALFFLRYTDACVGNFKLDLGTLHGDVWCEENPDEEFGSKWAHASGSELEVSSQNGEFV